MQQKLWIGIQNYPDKIVAKPAKKEREKFTAAKCNDRLKYIHWSRLIMEFQYKNIFLNENDMGKDM